MEHRCQSSQTTGGQEMCRVCVLSTLENRKPGRGLLESNPVEPPLRDKTISCCSEKPDLPPIVNTSKLPEAAVVPQEDKPNIIKPFFSTAGGKLVKMSDEALKKAREMFSEIDDGPIKKDSCTVKQNLERNNKRNNPKNRNLQNLASPTVTTKETTNSHPPSGFSTASGKTVAVSANALHKARILLSESDGNTDDSIGQIKKRTINAHCEEMAPVLKPRHSDTKEIEKNILVIKEETSENLSTIQASNSFLPGMSSFTTASAKTLTISEEALRKAKEMFSEIDNIHSEHDKPGDYPIDHPLFVSKVHPSLQKTQTILETSNLPNSTTNTFGFSTASGKHVSVSETAMQQVKDLFQEFTEPENPQESGLYYNKGGGNISKKANISTPKVNKQKFITDPADKLSNLQCRGRNVENNNVDTPPFASSSDQHPVPKHSTPFYATRVLNKNNFVSSIASHTPENYFEIEAAESAKAFMDDEDLTDGMMATETVNKPRNGKRLRSDDRTAHGEPPIKRQLLPEFDRSLVQGSKLTMKPLTSSPHSELKDRRKFLYNVSLKASFCDPTSLSAVKKEAKDSPLTTRRHFSSSSPSFQQPLSENSANGAKDEKPQYKMVSHRQATSKSVSFFKMEVHMPLEEEARNQSDPDFHTDEGNLKQKACSELGSDFSQLVARLSCARDMQEMRIRKKQRQIIKPHSGILYQLKASSTERIPLFSAVQGKPPTVYTKAQLYRFGVLKNHIGINSETARTFHFHCLEYFTKDTLMPNGGVQIADGGWLVPSDRLTAGREEFYRALCDTTGVDPKLISPEWVYNHYRWIVWKLAAMEVMFPDMFASRCLTPERVLLQLKYRQVIHCEALFYL
uniref:Breast cancer type 2 susceptibility protein helical domain-containing protein n=1 Tax=Pyxicephalus adspersus TaxID=30357 RepID=A0AAV3AMD5_PYXAD|nr:TPA: hypothetical protein GDO54_000387 [Pyxicephalus adspersus]